ncbi:hypothetical protein AGMMS49965_25280 [Bacteroidia bacterium]|nr:hypothetical protein AGMMS4957_12300 [Bacteroidia bacterium]GHT47287.1 hypothetical protein AGMMS49965_25280 [Bacteroidia bacterium]
METMTGVQYEKGTRGRARYARIDLDKYDVTMDELQAFLNGIMSNKGNRRVVSQVEQSPYNPEYVKMINEQEKLPGVKIKIEDLWK